MRFRQKVAIVTGAASGIGLATAQRLAAEGAEVVTADRHPANNSVGLPLRCDVSRQEDVAATVNAALQRFGRWDILVNNAGIMIFKPLVEQTTDDWQQVLAVDLLGAFYFIREAFHHMHRGGSIVNVASIHAIETTPLVSAYAAAKAALVSLSRSAALEGKKCGIRVNAILPGAVDTPMLWQNPNVKNGLEQIDRGMTGKPDEIAAAIAFLASDDASFLDGTAVTVDGGRLGRL